MDAEHASLDPAAVFARLEQQQQQLARTEEDLRRQRLELAGALAELKAVCEAAGPLKAEVDSLREENEHLRRLGAARDFHPGRAAADDPMGGKIDGIILEELTALRRQLEEKDLLVEELRAAAPPAGATPESRDIADYEAELNAFRRQLEVDRQALNGEIEQLRIRNKELKEAARQAELELSRERAQLARERAQLDRLRDEIRQEVERAQREASVRECLAPVQRLQEEVSERHRGQEPAGPRDNGTWAPRWRTLLNKLGDTPA